MTMFNTLLLDQSQWDLVLDAFGNIAMAAPPYAVAQDVASAARLFQGELYYDSTKGVPYFDQILGHLPPFSLFLGYLENSALTVPGVVKSQCIISTFTERAIVGQLQFIDETGAANGISF